MSVLLIVVLALSLVTACSPSDSSPTPTVSDGPADEAPAEETPDEEPDEEAPGEEDPTDVELGFRVDSRGDVSSDLDHSVATSNPRPERNPPAPDPAEENDDSLQAGEIADASETEDYDVVRRPPNLPRRPRPREGGIVDYPIVYVRGTRLGDTIKSRWPEISNPVAMEGGSDLMLLYPDGTERMLVDAGPGAIVDPYVSFDAEWIYYAKIHDLSPEKLNEQRRRMTRSGSDIFKVHLDSGEIVQLTNQEFTPNTGAANWSSHHLGTGNPEEHWLGFGIYNLGPCPLPGGRLAFTSSRNAFLPNGSDIMPGLQLFVMDDDGRNVELVGHMNLSAVLHPTILVDGRIMFSTSEGQGARDSRQWGLWAIWPDGRNWEPLMSAFERESAFHLQTQLSDGTIVVTEYYNRNNNGFGTFLAFNGWRRADEPAFGSENEADGVNPQLRQDGNGPSEVYPFSPQGLRGLTPFTHGKDSSAAIANGELAGKVTHPSGAPGNDLLLVWSPGAAHDATCHDLGFFYDGGIYLLVGGETAESHHDLVRIKNDPRYNEMFPRAVIPYKEIYGRDEPYEIEWLPNDGKETHELPEGTPFGLIGSSSLIKRDTRPGRGNDSYDGLEPFNSSYVLENQNWLTQGADAGKYEDDDIWALRVLAMEPTSHRSYGPNLTADYQTRPFINHASERLRILGEIPVRKNDTSSRPILDPEGNPDTSFLLKIPADTPFTFQTIDRDGMVLNMSQTWHQLRPGEKRTDCGGCHSHSQLPLRFEDTFASSPDYEVQNLSHVTPLLTRGPNGRATVETRPTRVVDVEYYRDIKPLLERSCVPCHSLNGRQEAGLVLDDTQIVRRVENTYNRLARDHLAHYGPPSMHRTGTWRATNSSRYVRKFQSRRSLLIWKIYGRRLDGWTNEDHPTETIPGDRSTFPEGADITEADLDYVGTPMPPPGSNVPPLSNDEKQLFVRWVDLGCPIDVAPEYGWHIDDLRPTLTLSSPRSLHTHDALREIRFGAFDANSGLDRTRISVRADFVVNEQAPGEELASLFSEVGDHVWSMRVYPPITELDSGTITIRVYDRQGNVTSVERMFLVGQ